MAAVKTNISSVVGKLKANFELLKDKEYLLRPLAIETIPLMKERIHDKGQDSSGEQIGTYSSEYMKVRTGNFGNSGKVSRGPNKGKTKNAGIITRGPHKGEQRPQYHRNSDPKVIVSLTTKLEQDYQVIATDKGYGIGFNDPINKQKAGWVEETYHKIIFNLSPDEKQYITDRIKELVNGAFG